MLPDLNRRNTSWKTDRETGHYSLISVPENFLCINFPCINLTAFRTTKTLWSLGSSECNRVKQTHVLSKYFLVNSWVFGQTGWTVFTQLILFIGLMKLSSLWIPEATVFFWWECFSDSYHSTGGYYFPDSLPQETINPSGETPVCNVAIQSETKRKLSCDANNSIPIKPIVHHNLCILLFMITWVSTCDLGKAGEPELLRLKAL